MVKIHSRFASSAEPSSSRLDGLRPKEVVVTGDVTVCSICYGQWDDGATRCKDVATFHGIEGNKKL